MLNKEELLAAVRAELEPERRRRVGPKTKCRACNRPMVSWTRERWLIPDGHVMHYARGFCTGCRPAYKAAGRAEGWSGYKGLRKEIDRKRHSAPVVGACCLGCGRPMVPQRELKRVDGAVLRRRGSLWCVNCTPRCVVCGVPVVSQKAVHVPEGARRHGNGGKCGACYQRSRVSRETNNPDDLH